MAQNIDWFGRYGKTQSPDLDNLLTRYAYGGLEALPWYREPAHITAAKRAAARLAAKYAPEAQRASGLVGPLPLDAYGQTAAAQNTQIRQAQQTQSPAPAAAPDLYPDTGGMDFTPAQSGADAGASPGVTWGTEDQGQTLSALQRQALADLLGQISQKQVSLDAQSPAAFQSLYPDTGAMNFTPAQSGAATAYPDTGLMDFTPAQSALPAGVDQTLRETIRRELRNGYRDFVPYEDEWHIRMLSEALAEDVGKRFKEVPADTLAAIAGEELTAERALRQGNFTDAKPRLASAGELGYTGSEEAQAVSETGLSDGAWTAQGAPADADFPFAAPGSMEGGWEDIENMFVPGYTESGPRARISTRSGGTLIFASPTPPEKDADGEAARDFGTNDKYKSDLYEMGPIIGYMADLYDVDTFEVYGAEIVENTMKSLADWFAAGDPQMREVAHGMFDHFISGNGEDYRNPVLTQRVIAHASTRRFIEETAEIVRTYLESHGGDLAALQSDTNFNKDMKKIYGPKFNTKADLLGGLTICLNDTWGYYANVADYEFDGKNYSGTIRYTVYDHFGLDQDDLSGRNWYKGAFPPFAAWYTLQHYKGCEGQYKPFVTYGIRGAL